MLHAPHPLSFAYCTESYSGNPSLSPGTVVNLGASNADAGTVVALIGTPLTHDVELLEIIVTASSGAGTGIDSSGLVDIVIDPAGGTTWDTTNRLIQSLMVGFMIAPAATGQAPARTWRFPLWIPAGATIGALGRTVIGTDQTANVMLHCYGGVNRPGLWWCGQKVDAVGETRASSAGTSITPNATANTYPSFASFGSATARRYGCIVPSICLSTATTSGAQKQLQLAIGGAQIGPTINMHGATTEVGGPVLGGHPLIWKDIPEGTQFQARLRSGASSSSADQVIIHGVA